jgi:predicted nuclease of predicted toxin-antitoxin system
MPALRSSGHDVEWVGDWSRDPGDEQILETAAAHGQVLVTLDKDFGELAVLYRRPHSGIVRLVNLRAQDQGPVCVAALRRYGTELEQGAIVTAEDQRVRIRPPEATQR